MITFVRTRHFYQSYTDFWKLVELSNFPTIYVDELRPQEEGIFIVAPMNGEWRPHLDNHKGRRNAHLILWNLERPSGSAGAIRNYARDNWELLHNRYLDEIWVSDAQLADETLLRYVKLGSHPDLGRPGNWQDKIYDLIHLSYEIPRRVQIYKNFVGRIAPNAWPPDRDQYLRKSRFALNVHQDNHPFQEPLRFALFAAYGLPIISESLIRSYPWDAQTIKTFNYADLVANVQKILEEPYNEYAQMGMRGRKLLCHEYPFRANVELAVEQSVGDWR